MSADLKIVSNHDPVRAKALEAALAQIDRSFGKGSAMRLGDREKVDIEAISTGSLGLDVALGIGGLPKGRIVEIYGPERSEEHTSELQSLMRISYAVFCLKKKNNKTNKMRNTTQNNKVQTRHKDTNNN